MPTILHIGCDKTGTTAIQRALASRRSQLLDAGFLYPDLDGRPDHQLLLTEPSALHIDDRHTTLLLSFEGFWPAGPEGMELLLDVLPKPISVLAWARSPQRYVDAAFRQQCRLARSPRHLAALLRVVQLPSAINPVANRCIRRYEQLRPWKERFGESLTVFDYEKDSNDIVDAFSRATKLPELEVAVERSNPSPSLVALHALAMARSGGQFVDPNVFLRAAVELGEIARSPMVPEPVRQSCWRRTSDIRRAVGLDQHWETSGDVKPRLDQDLAAALLSKIDLGSSHGENR